MKYQIRGNKQLSFTQLGIQLYKSKLARISLHFCFPKSFLWNNLRLFLYDFDRSDKNKKTNRECITAAMNWLYLAFLNGKRGVSASYHIDFGWDFAYPETTGYIIETFFDYVIFLKGKSISDNFADKYSDAAIEMGKWLIDIQLKCGGYPGGPYNPKNEIPNVFDTGQIIFGLLKVYQSTNDKKFLHAAIKAGDWLLENQNVDGSWSNYTYESGGRSYQSRVSWALILLSNETNNEKYKITAIKNLDWVIKNQKENFWFDHANFFDKNTILTHTLAYTVRGLFESGILLKNELYINSALNTAQRMMEVYERRRYALLPAVFDNKWNSLSDYSCLTGCAQFSFIWLKTFYFTNDIRYLNAALKINSILRDSQYIKNENLNFNGAIKGSIPIYGDYMPFSFPNWATKFFVDALILEEKSREKIGI